MLFIEHILLYIVSDYKIGKNNGQYFTTSSAKSVVISVLKNNSNTPNPNPLAPSLQTFGKPLKTEFSNRPRARGNMHECLLF